MDLYDIALVLVGIAALGAAVLPRLVADRPLSFPILFVGLGVLVFALPLGLEAPDPVAGGDVAERLTELGVIIALTGAGLKLDRPPGLRRWATTWRLLAVTMPLSIAAGALLGWVAVGLAPAAAMLVGAALAPTDPVLASDVQSGPPGEAGSEVRFSLTSEAGLNDGLAFPFTNAAVAMAAAGAAPAGWIGEWFAVDVVYRVGAGIALGWVMGRALWWLIFRLPATSTLAESTEGLAALAITLLAYGATELAGGYGFLAVFVAAVTIRQIEREHTYHAVLHQFSEEAERFVTAIILVLLGGAVVAGVLEPLTVTAALAAAGFVLVARPLAGMAGLLGHGGDVRERAAIAFFGIRGVGSLYYTAYGLNHAPFTREQTEAVWAFVVLVVLISIVVHGVTATRAMRFLEERGRA